MEITSRQFRGRLLRDARKARKLSQTQLGAKIGAHVTSISDWERGANAPSGRHVAALSRELGVSAEHFYESDDDEESDMVADLVKAIRAVVRDELAREKDRA
jgi:transcriptional regulator with XRE-family HTH domain